MTNLLNTIMAYVAKIFETITRFVNWIGDLFVSIFKAAWDFLTDVSVWLFESLFKLVADVIGGVNDTLDIAGLAAQVQSLWNQIPPSVLQVLSAIGIGSALGIVVLGILIRMALQLIPFVRLGS